MYLGKASLSYEEPVYIQGYASVVGKKEGEGPLADLFDEIVEDPMFGGENWEDAEGRLQLRTAQTAIKMPVWNRRISGISLPVIC